MSSYINRDNKTEGQNRIFEIEKRLSDLEKEKSILLNELFRLRSTTNVETPLLGFSGIKICTCYHNRKD